MIRFEGIKSSKDYKNLIIIELKIKQPLEPIQTELDSHQTQ